jgi:hypothetical protein
MHKKDKEYLLRILALETARLEDESTHYHMPEAQGILDSLDRITHEIETL